MTNTRDAVSNTRGSGTRFADVAVEKRGLNPEVSKVKVRPEPPRPIVTNPTTPKPSSDN